MMRLAATVGTDLRLQLRNGFYLASAFIVVFSIVLLRWLPPETARLILPVVLIENVLANSFYFVSGLLLLERVEGTFAAQSVTPLRVNEYLASKVGTLTLLSLAESLPIAGAVLGIGPWLPPMAAGVALAAVSFCLVGIALVLRYDSINEFMMPTVLYTFLLTLPIFGVFGVGAPSWYLPHPIQGPLSLMTPDVPRSGAEFVYAIGYPLVWIVPAYLASRQALARARGA
jgi:fluoroquinolone transport system permease protein